MNETKERGRGRLKNVGGEGEKWIRWRIKTIKRIKKKKK